MAGVAGRRSRSGCSRTITAVVSRDHGQGGKAPSSPTGQATFLTCHAFAPCAVGVPSAACESNGDAVRSLATLSWASRLSSCPGAEGSAPCSRRPTAVRGLGGTTATCPTTFASSLSSGEVARIWSSACTLIPLGVVTGGSRTSRCPAGRGPILATISADGCRCRCRRPTYRRAAIASLVAAISANGRGGPGVSDAAASGSAKVWSRVPSYGRPASVSYRFITNSVRTSRRVE